MQVVAMPIVTSKILFLIPDSINEVYLYVICSLVNPIIFCVGYLCQNKVKVGKIILRYVFGRNKDLML